MGASLPRSKKGRSAGRGECSALLPPNACRLGGSAAWAPAHPFSRNRAGKAPSFLRPPAQSAPVSCWLAPFRLTDGGEGSDLPLEPITQLILGHVELKVLLQPKPEFRGRSEEPRQP